MVEQSKKSLHCIDNCRNKKLFCEGFKCFVAFLVLFILDYGETFIIVTSFINASITKTTSKSDNFNISCCMQFEIIKKRTG